MYYCMKINPLPFLLFLFYTSLCSSQIDTIKEARIVFKLPNNNWSFYERQQPDTNLIGYAYVHSQVIDSNWHSTVPNIAVIIHRLSDSVTSMDFALWVIGSGKLHVIDMLPAAEKLPNLKRYSGAVFKCSDTISGLEHIVYIAFLKEKRKGVEIAIDVKSEFFDRFAKEFDAIFKSVKEI